MGICREDDDFAALDSIVEHAHASFHNFLDSNQRNTTTVYESGSRCAYRSSHGTTNGY